MPGWFLTYDAFAAILCIVGAGPARRRSGAQSRRRWIMHPRIAEKRADIEALCRRLGVRRLDLFGSATGESFDAESSDVDFLVEFEVAPGFDYFSAYFSLKENLEVILGRPVDLITRSSIRNPYFLERILHTREPLYAA
jgi:predicted nucleotidyltransferase